MVAIKVKPLHLVIRHLCFHWSFGYNCGRDFSSMQNPQFRKGPYKGKYCLNYFSEQFKRESS